MHVSNTILNGLIFHIDHKSLSDFASILNFGYIADTDEVNEEDRSIKTKTGFIPLDLKNIKTQVTKAKEKVTAKVT